MYNGCDVNDDLRASFGDIRNFIEGLSSNFEQKEIYAVMQYLDIDKSKVIERDEFIRQMKKGEKICE